MSTYTFYRSLAFELIAVGKEITENIFPLGFRIIRIIPPAHTTDLVRPSVYFQLLLVKDIHIRRDTWRIMLCEAPV